MSLASASTGGLAAPFFSNITHVQNDEVTRIGETSKIKVIQVGGTKNEQQAAAEGGSAVTVSAIATSSSGAISVAS